MAKVRFWFWLVIFGREWIVSWLSLNIITTCHWSLYRWYKRTNSVPAGYMATILYDWSPYLVCRTATQLLVEPWKNIYHYQELSFPNIYRWDLIIRHNQHLIDTSFASTTVRPTQNGSPSRPDQYLYGFPINSIK